MGASPHTPGHSADSTGGRALGFLGSSFRSPVRPAPDCPLGCPCCCPHPPVRPTQRRGPPVARTASAVPSVHTSTSSWSCCLNSRSGVQLPFACVPWTPLCFDTPQRRPLLPPACPPLSWGPGASGVVTVYPWSRPGSRGHRAPLFLTPPPPPWPPSSARAAEALALGRGRVGVRDPPLGQPWPGLMPPWPGLGFQLHPTLELPLNLRFSLRGEQVPLPPGSARSGRAWKDPETQEALVGVGQEPAPLWSVGGVWVEPAGGCAKGRGGS